MKSNSDVIVLNTNASEVNRDYWLFCNACDEILPMVAGEDVGDMDVPMAVVIETIRVHVIPTINPKHEEKMLDLNRDLELQEILDEEATRNPGWRD